MRAVEGMIAILVGAILVFAVVIPIITNGTNGSAYTGQYEQNVTAQGATIQLFNATDCGRYSLATIQHVWNATGNDVSAQVAATAGTINGFSWTNGTLMAATGPVSITVNPNLTVDYRCLDGAYITNTTARGIAGILPTLTVVLIIVALAAMVYVKRD